MRRSISAPRFAYFTPLIGLAAIGVFWFLLWLAAITLIPVSAIAHAIIYFANIFVLLPSVMFLVAMVSAAVLATWSARFIWKKVPG